MESPSRMTIRRDGRALLDQIQSTTFDNVSAGREPEEAAARLFVSRVP